MRQSLAEPLIEHICYRGRKYKLKPSFGRVITCYETLQNEAFDSFDKVDMCLKLLVKNKIRLYFMSTEKKAELFELIFNQIIKVNKGKSGATKAFDFLQDSQYIYAGFMQCYKIDLMQCRDTLHWWQFMSLFSCLSEDTRMAQIISVRTKPIPKATKYNADERLKLIRLKQEYMLEMSDEERNANLQQGLAKMAAALGGMIKRKT